MSRLSELYLLISGMTSAERRHFRVFAKASSGHEPSQHARLFDLLESIPKVNESELIERIRKAGLSPNLATLIPRLNGQVLTCLVQLKSSKSVDAQLYHLLAEIEVLYSKQMMAQVKRWIRRGKGWARKYSRAQTELEILQWERKVVAQENRKDLARDLGALREEEIQLVEWVQLQRELSHLQSEVRMLARQGLSPKIPAEYAMIQACYQPELLERGQNSGDQLCLVYAGNIMGIYHVLCRNHQLALKSYLPLIDFWESNPVWFEDQPELSLMIFNNFHLASMYASRDMERLEHFFSLLHGYNFKDPNHRFLFQRTTFQAEFITYMNTGRREKTAELVDRLRIWMEGMGKKLNPSQRLTFLYNILVFQFLVGNWRAANRVVIEILNLSARQFRQDIQDCARVMQIVLHFELGNEDLCENLVRNHGNFFRRARGSETPHAEFAKGMGKVLEGFVEAGTAQLLARLESGESFLGKEELKVWCKARQKKSNIWEEFLDRLKVEA